MFAGGGFGAEGAELQGIELASQGFEKAALGRRSFFAREGEGPPGHGLPLPELRPLSASGDAVLVKGRQTRVASGRNRCPKPETIRRPTAAGDHVGRSGRVFPAAAGRAESA